MLSVLHHFKQFLCTVCSLYTSLPYLSIRSCFETKSQKFKIKIKILILTAHTPAAVKISLPHSTSNNLARQFDGVLKFCHPTRPSKSCARSNKNYYCIMFHNTVFPCQRMLNEMISDEICSAYRFEHNNFEERCYVRGAVSGRLGQNLAHMGKILGMGSLILGMGMGIPVYRLPFVVCTLAFPICPFGAVLKQNLKNVSPRMSRGHLLLQSDDSKILKEFE
eukprot:sb/3469808/